MWPQNTSFGLSGRGSNQTWGGHTAQGGSRQADSREVRVSGNEASFLGSTTCGRGVWGGWISRSAHGENYSSPVAGSRRCLRLVHLSRGVHMPDPDNVCDVFQVAVPTPSTIQLPQPPGRCLGAHRAEADLSVALVPPFPGKTLALDFKNKPVVIATISSHSNELVTVITRCALDTLSYMRYTHTCPRLQMNITIPTLENIVGN